MSDAPASRPSEKPIRDAATLVLVRAGDGPVGRGSAESARILMGQRGGGARFMPNKVVFPGGGVDAEDYRKSATRLTARCAERLAIETPAAALPLALAHAAIRETFEETGLRLARRAIAASDAPPPRADPAEKTPSWPVFEADGAAPSLDRLRFMFRAITPPSLPIRFDARFFLARAEDLLDDPDDLSRASGELSHLNWTPLAEARSLELPFITSVVLAELQEMIETGLFEPGGLFDGAERAVPFFRHDGGRSRFEAL